MLWPLCRFGLRQPGLGSLPYNRLNFAWEDGSIKPALNPSGQAYDGLGYSHWGLYAAGPSDGEPNNAAATNQQCAASTDFHYEFAYYSGPFTRAARSTVSNYIRSANSSLNLWSWNDRHCGESFAYICELTGETAHSLPGLQYWLAVQASNAVGAALTF